MCLGNGLGMFGILQKQPFSNDCDAAGVKERRPEQQSEFYELLCLKRDNKD